MYDDELYVRVNDLEQIIKGYDDTLCLIGFWTPQFNVTDGLANEPIYRKQMEIAYLCNIDHRVVFSQQFKDYIEITTFGTSSYQTSTFLNFCIQNLIVLQNFIQYFKTEAEDLIEAAKKDPIMLSPRSPLKAPKSTSMDFVGYDFKNKKKITLKLTGQEAASLKQLGTGKTFKEAAKNLLISPRTVENHIYSAKMKSGCNSTNDLVELFSTLTRR